MSKVGERIVAVVKGLIIWALLPLLVLSCSKDGRFAYERSDSNSPVETRSVTPAVEECNVMLLYSAGYNSLYSYLKEDIEELSEGYVPHSTFLNESKSIHANTMAEDVLLVFSRLAQGGNNPPESALFRIYMRPDSTVVQDTLRVWGEEVNAASKETMEDVLNTVREIFPSSSYGMVFSSHASGWLPEGYYRDPGTYENNAMGDFWSTSSIRRSREVFPALEDFPAVKSFGQDEYPGSQVEMSLKEFADAIPFCLDYLLIDACLSGCVEVAAQLRGKANLVGFSQTEVLADGFNYKAIASLLLKDTPDPIGVCKDYFDYYDKQSGVYRSATISVIDTREMGDLIEVCQGLFEKYRDQINTLDGNKVQGYFRFNRHFFYDLKDILLKAGIDAQEVSALEAALSKCVVYKAATPYFMQNGSSGFAIKTFSGFSMYLPSQGTDILDTYYKSTLSWNQETGLVQ